MSSSTITSIKIRRFTGNGSEKFRDQLAIEAPLEIQLAYVMGEEYIMKNISVTMRTPGNDKELATGFLFTEGIIKHLSELQEISQSALGCNRVLVSLQPGCRPLLQNTERNFYTTSSCGVCGKTSIEAIKTISSFLHIEDEISLHASLFGELPGLLRQHQMMFKRTGGMHAAALFNLSGDLVMVREDVGRHNALDKLIGAALLSGQLPLNQSILLLSGRASFELIQKAAMAGIRVVAAIGAPSSLAVDLAIETGITLLGFLSKTYFNIYCGEKRINNYE